MTSSAFSGEPTGPPRAGLCRAEKLTILGMGGFLVAVTAAAWAVLALVVAPAHYQLGHVGVFGLGLGLTAFLLGVRHAFDADHIAAIDNTTRKLLAERGQRSRPLSVGFWFALGHSTMVFIMVLLTTFGVRAVAGDIAHDDSALNHIGGLISTSVSGLFLLFIGVINFVVLIGIVRVFRRMRAGEFDEATLETQLNSRGFLTRILGGATKAVHRPGHMFGVGLLFGLGFDTATEVSLLVIAGGAAAGALPWYAVLVLPVLFAAGMSLFDSLDGVFMCLAYNWAFLRPVRKVFYNITMTALSVAVALIIGLIELVGLLAEKLSLTAGPLGKIAALNLGDVGFIVVGLFALVWSVAVLIWRVGRVEERWTARLTQPPRHPDAATRAGALAIQPQKIAIASWADPEYASTARKSQQTSAEHQDCLGWRAGGAVPDTRSVGRHCHSG